MTCLLLHSAYEFLSDLWLLEPAPVLAALAQQTYYDLYAPDEDCPEFLCQAPAPLHGPLWSSVVNGCTKVVEPDATGSPYLIPKLEALSYRWVEEDAERTRAALERLKEMTSR